MVFRLPQVWHCGNDARRLGALTTGSHTAIDLPARPLNLEISRPKACRRLAFLFEAHQNIALRYGHGTHLQLGSLLKDVLHKAFQPEVSPQGEYSITGYPYGFFFMGSCPMRVYSTEG